jgi:hypothetical protein
MGFSRFICSRTVVRRAWKLRTQPVTSKKLPLNTKRITGWWAEHSGLLNTKRDVESGMSSRNFEVSMVCRRWWVCVVWWIWKPGQRALTRRLPIWLDEEEVQRIGSK